MVNGYETYPWESKAEWRQEKSVGRKGWLDGVGV